MAVTNGWLTQGCEQADVEEHLYFVLASTQHLARRLFIQAGVRSTRRPMAFDERRLRPYVMPRVFVVYRLDRAQQIWVAMRPAEGA